MRRLPRRGEVTALGDEPAGRPEILSEPRDQARGLSRGKSVGLGAFSSYSEHMSDGPKSALELALERLKKQDAQAGVEQKPLTDEQREAIAEARNLYEARVAERRIMHQSQVAAVFDPQELELHREHLLRDLAQFESDRDAKIREIRGE